MAFSEQLPSVSAQLRARLAIYVLKLEIENQDAVEPHK